MSVSPPPFKRRRLSRPPSPTPAKGTTASIVPSPAAKIPSKIKELPLRIFSWNVNSIHPFLPSTNQKIFHFLLHPPKPSSTSPEPSLKKFSPLRTCFRRWEWPHIICLQEVKIVRTDRDRQSRLRKIVNQPIDDADDVSDKSRLYTSHLSLPRDRFNAEHWAGKVNGVCTLLRQDLQYVQVKEADWDLEGRVLITELPASALVVINVYCVNGTGRPYHDPLSGKVIGSRHSHKRTFHAHLRDQVLAYERAGWEVVVIGDINVARTEIDSFPALRMAKEHQESRADFEKKIIGGEKGEGAGMLDVFRHLRGEERKYTYRPTSKPWGEAGDRVDMALVTKGLLEQVRDADILDTKEERGPSDHVPIFINLKGQDGVEPESGPKEKRTHEQISRNEDQ